MALSPAIQEQVRQSTQRLKSSSVLVYRDGVPLVEGLDYVFGYNSTSGIIRLTPLAGIWRSESVYTIRFINNNESSVVARAGADYIDGAAFYIIDASGKPLTFEFDLGYRVTVPSSNGIDDKYRWYNLYHR